MSRDWSSLDLPEWLTEAIESFGFERMTPVQAATIPLFSANKDVVVEATTGSGKTLAFLIPILMRLTKSDESTGPKAIIISPTRELTEQIHRVLCGLLEFLPSKRMIRTQLLIGGSTPTHTDLKVFQGKKPHIIVASPGRLLELLSSPSVNIQSLECLVLDEADRLLDLGFDRTLNQIFHYTPKQKRVGLFSATIHASGIEQVVRAGLRNPVRIDVKVGKTRNQATPTSLAISYMIADWNKKLPLLVSLLNTRQYRKAIVYYPTCISVTHYYGIMKFLNEVNDVKLFSLHGKLPAGTRTKTLESFMKCPEKCVLMTTDVASRGLDIPEVELVIQLEPPSDPNVFLHRAGRAGRAGKEGSSIVFLVPGREEDFTQFMAVRKVAMKHDTSVDIEKLPDYTDKIKKWMIEDRARHDVALRSFVSFVRFYAKHTATSIFRASNLDLVELAKSYNLFQLPRMPELKDRDDIPAKGILDGSVDMDTYAYKDPKREKARLQELKDKAEQAKIPFKKPVRSTEAWSEKKARKETGQERREKRRKKKVAIAMQKHGSDDDDSDDDSEIEKDWKEEVRERKKAKTQVASTFDDL